LAFVERVKVVNKRLLTSLADANRLQVSRKSPKAAASICFATASIISSGEVAKGIARVWCYNPASKDKSKQYAL
jgi:hypothetical protein